MTTPLVSVGITTYRRPELLVETIGSVLRQTLKDFEVVVCDDHSRDRTEEAVRRLDDSRIRYYCNLENVGQTKNTNRCIQLATGKYFCWNSDDNVYLPRFLEALVGVLEAHPEIGAAACSTIVADSRLRPLHEVRTGTSVTIDPPGSALARFVMRHEYNPSSTLYRREWLIQNRLLNEDFLDDWAWLGRYVYRYGCIRVPEALFCYRVHDQRQSVRLVATEDLDPVWNQLVQYDDIFREVPRSDRDVLRVRKRLYRRVARRGVLMCLGSLGKGRVWLARKQLREVIGAHPWVFVDPLMCQTVIQWFGERRRMKQMLRAMEEAGSKSSILPVQASS